MLKPLRRAAKSLLSSIERNWNRVVVNSQIQIRGQKASDQIREQILLDRPFLAARLGTGELNTLKKIRRFHQGRAAYADRDHLGLEKIAGFFPLDQEHILRFYDRMVADLALVDLLGSWLPDEALFSRELRGAQRCPLEDLEPYYHPDPWSSSLEGRRVLVVHPFEDSIRTQYARRQTLFQDPRVLPRFDLITYKSVQTLGTAHDRSRFGSWFEALASMEQGVSQLDFDVAIIGCGAYGLPLAAHVKRMGKVAIHLGGATQILFGIRGSRWDSIPSVARLFNESWVRPLEEERPNNYKEIEGGSYW